MNSNNLNNKNKDNNQRCTRSISSPPGNQNYRSVEPQRTQSLFGFGTEQQNQWQMQNFLSPYTQQHFNYNYPGLIFVNPNMCPIPSVPSTSAAISIRGFSNGAISHHWTRKKKAVPIRGWEPDKPIGNGEKQFIFSVMSYNVLAQDLVQGHMYLYKDHDQKALDWEVRWVNILNEIGTLDPDIICFQEVQESHIENYFNILKGLGYESIYKKRTGIRTDGCAIYYKAKKLQLLEYATVEYFQADVAVLDRDNVGIIVKLKPKQGHEQPFVVATTHLLYNPRREDVRLAQMQYLMTEIDKIAFLGANQQGESLYLPIIMTGDLNLTPESAIYEFITKGKLHYENLSKCSLVKNGANPKNGKLLIPKSLQITDNCQYAEIVKTRNEELRFKGDGENGFKFSSGTLSHPFLLKSAYSHFKNSDIEGTTYQDRWITVDYIFYSGKTQNNVTTEDKLKIISKYQLLTKRQLNNIRIPNHKLGSDHFSLIVKFLLE